MMLKIRFVLGLSIWVAILPYLGFPRSFKNFLISLSGLALAYLAYLIYKNVKKETKETKTFDSFSENTGMSEEKI